MFGSIAVNSFWPSDAIWWQRSRSTLAQVMACCLTAICVMCLKNTFLNFTTCTTFHSDQWIKTSLLWLQKADWYQRLFWNCGINYCNMIHVLKQDIWTGDINSRNPFYWHGLTLIPAWISNDMSNKVWDEITYPVPNFNGATVEVWEWISNFISHFTRHVITYLCLG